MTRIVTSLLLLPLLVIAGCDSGTDAPPNQPPSVDFSYSPEDPRPGTTVNFTANASDSDGKIVSYSWDFNSDGIEDSTGPNPSYEFASQGEFSVMLEVTDNEDATSSTSQNVSVAAPNQPPSVDFSYSPENPRAGTTVDFTANANDPDGDIASYSWDFNGDNVQDASGPNPSYEFPSQGTFSITLEVTDNEDATTSASESISVSQQYTRVRITDVVIQDMPFTTDDGQGWDFGSGPDVYLLASNETEGESVSASSAIDDVGPSNLPINPSGGDFTISDLSDEYAISLYDEDPDANDFIGGIVYEYGNLIGNYPGSIELDAGGGIVLDVSLEWLE